jgi:hypothetical protein
MDTLRAPLLVALAAVLITGFFFHLTIVDFIVDIVDFIEKVYFVFGVLGFIAGLIFAVSLRLWFPELSTGTIVFIAVACGIGTGIFFEGFTRASLVSDPDNVFRIEQEDATLFNIAASIAAGVGIALACSEANMLAGYYDLKLTNNRAIQVAVLVSVIPSLATYGLLKAGVLDDIVDLLPKSHNFVVSVLMGTYALFMGPILAWYLQAQAAEDAAKVAAAMTSPPSVN